MGHFYYVSYEYVTDGPAVLRFLGKLVHMVLFYMYPITCLVPLELSFIIHSFNDDFTV